MQYLIDFFKFVVELIVWLVTLLYNIVATVFSCIEFIISVFSALPFSLTVFIVGICAVSIVYKIISLGSSGD